MVRATPTFFAHARGAGLRLGLDNKCGVIPKPFQIKPPNLKMSSSPPASAGDHWSVSAPWVFRDTEYKVAADVREDVLIVQVEDCLAADQWTGHFDSKREISSTHELQ